MTWRVLTLCTGNATRSVMLGALLAAQRPELTVRTAGTLSIDGLVMSWRTRAGFESIGVDPPLGHRSRQAREADVDTADLIIGAAPEHIAWVRREHPGAAARAGTLIRLAEDLAADQRPLPDRVVELGLGDVELQPWEEVVDPGGGEVEAFTACAQEIATLVSKLAPKLLP